MPISRHGSARMARAIILASAVLPSSVLLVDSLSAQPSTVSVFGRVADEFSGAVVAGATVSLVADAEDDEPRRHAAVSGTRGDFLVRGVVPGSYMLSVAAPGYDPVRTVISVSTVASLILEIDLTPAAIRVQGVTASSSGSSRLERSGFPARKASGMGEFIEPPDRLAWRTFSALDVLRLSPLIGVVRPRGTRDEFVTLRRTCRPDIVVDGHNLGNSVSPDLVVSAGDLEAVEVHSGPSVPTRFSRNSCGAVLFWTRPRPDADGTPFSWKRAGALISLGVLATLLAR